MLMLRDPHCQEVDERAHFRGKMMTVRIDRAHDHLDGGIVGHERHEALTRLFDYYLHTAAAAMAVLRPAEPMTLGAVGPIHAHAAIVPVQIGSPAAALTWLDTERSGLLSAAQYMADNGWPGHASRMADVLLYYLDGRGHYPEAVALHGHGRRAGGHTRVPGKARAEMVR